MSILSKERGGERARDPYICLNIGFPTHIKPLDCILCLSVCLLQCVSLCPYINNNILRVTMNIRRICISNEFSINSSPKLRIVL